MNTSQIASVLVILASVATAHASLVSRARHMTTGAGRPVTSEIATLHDTFEPSYELDETVIVGDAPHNEATRAEHTAWTCGPVEANKVGGSQRTCEWVRP